MAKEDRNSHSKSKHEASGEDESEEDILDSIPYLKFVLFAVALLVISATVIVFLPLQANVAHPTVDVVGAILGSEETGAIDWRDCEMGCAERAQLLCHD